MRKRIRSRAGIALAFAILPGIVNPVAADSVSTKTAPGTVFQDFLRSGGMGPKMVVLPSGSFRMGCLSDDRSCSDDEKPVHDVRIARPFAVSVYEVTFEDYDRFRPDEADDEGWGLGRRPVINVSWEDAKAYVSWLSRETGAEYRLLSESEWEYAARAGSETKYSWGDEIGIDRANCLLDHCGDGYDYDGYDYTAPVGSFMPNGYGLYDMHGNVWEWVEDCWHGSYEGAPSDGSAWIHGGNCEYRVLRGGAWVYAPRYLRSADRIVGPAGYASHDLGVRVARALTP